MVALMANLDLLPSGQPALGGPGMHMGGMGPAGIMEEPMHGPPEQMRGPVGMGPHSMGSRPPPAFLAMGTAPSGLGMHQGLRAGTRFDGGGPSMQAFPPSGPVHGPGSEYLPQGPAQQHHIGELLQLASWGPAQAACLDQAVNAC